MDKKVQYPTNSMPAHLSHRQSLRWRLLALLGGMLLVTLLVIGAGVFFFISQNETRTWQERQGESARHAAETVATFIKRMQDMLIIVGSFEPKILIEEPQVMETLIEDNSALLELVRLDEGGTVFAGVYRDAPLLADLFTIPQSRWFIESKAGQLFLSSIQISPASQPYLIISIPASDGGVVAARLQMNVLWDVVASLNFGETGQAYVVNHESQIVGHTKPNVAVEKTTLQGRPEMIGILDTPDRVWEGTYINFEGVEVLGVTTPVLDTQWVVITEVSESEAFAVSRTASLLLGGGMALFGLLVMLVTGRFLGQLILSPMERLRAGAVRIGQGDLNHQIDLIQQDEVGQVAYAFNEMVNALSERDKQIAERNQALKESEERFRHVIASISDHIYMTELVPEGIPNNVYLSPNIEALAGYPREKFMENWNFWLSTVIHPDDKGVIADHIAQFREEKNNEAEYRLIRADGSTIWVRDNGRVARDFARDNLVVYGVVSDITERKQQALELSILLETAQAVSSTLNLEEVLTLVAKQMIKITGVTDCTLSRWDKQADTITTWIELRQHSPEYADEAGTAYALSDYPTTRSVLETRQPAMLITTDPNLNPDEVALLKEQKTLSLLLIPLITSQGVIGLVELDEEKVERTFTPAEIRLCQALADQTSVAIENARLYERAQQEIRERKRAEETLKHQRTFLQQVVDVNPHFIFAKDREGHFTLANEAFANAYRTTVQNLIGKTDHDFNPHKDLVARYHRDDMRVIESGQELLREEEEVRSISGEKFWRKTIKRPLLDKNGDVYQVLGVATDITDRKKFEVDLALARDQALEAARLKTQLLANVSHDLRTPMGAIIGYTEMLQEGVYGDISEEQYEATTEIIDSAGQLLIFVNNLLDQSRIEAGKIAIKVIDFSPTRLIDSVQAMLGVAAQTKGVLLTTDIAPDVPSILYGDPHWLGQISINLISNAIKFTEKGTVQMFIYQPNKTEWFLEVSDTGPGIPKEAQSYIFEPFRQVDGTVTRGHSGSGLGLSIVKQLTNLMGGEISLTSELGQGSTFTIQLPIKSIPKENEK